MDIHKGKQVTVTAAFKSKGIAVAFVQPPTWILTNSVGKTLLQGTAVPQGSKWSAILTVSSSYVVPGGEEDLTIEFFARSSAGKEYTVVKDLHLLDLEDGFKPVGILYSLITSANLVDEFYAGTNDVVAIDYKILTPNDTLIYTHPTISSPTAIQNTKKGYRYEVNLGRPPATTMLSYNDPFMGILEYHTASGETFTELHPIYAVNAKVATHCNALKQYLDKAQLIEIDQSLQWFLPEFTHYLQEGMKHINSAGVTMSYWTIADYPSAQLQQYLFAAAALYALNARYLAEGFNAFNFTGLNTSLEYDRREAITYKIEELKAYLEAGLAPMKAAVIANGYPAGTPAADSASATTVAPSMGLLGLQGSAVSNRVQRNRGTRRFI